MSERSSKHRVDEISERISAIRTNQDELCGIVDRLRERIANVEAMTVALARTHPACAALLATLRDAMTLPADADLTDDVLAHHGREVARINSLWGEVLASRNDESQRAIH
jgi:hypothetical protein